MYWLIHPAVQKSSRIDDTDRDMLDGGIGDRYVVSHMSPELLGFVRVKMRWQRVGSSIDNTEQAEELELVQSAAGDVQPVIIRQCGTTQCSPRIVCSPISDQHA